MLLWQYTSQLQDILRLHIRQHNILLTGLCLDIYRSISWEFQLRTAGLGNHYWNSISIPHILRPALKLSSNGIIYSRHHLAGQEALPYQTIQLHLILVKIFFNILWQQGHAGRTDCLMCLLSLSARLIHIRSLRCILLAETLNNIVLSLCLSLIRDTDRVGAHIGDKTQRALLS